MCTSRPTRRDRYNKKLCVILFVYQHFEKILQVEGTFYDKNWTSCV